jgi:hypothetical protein
LEANRRIQITKTELAISALFGFTRLYFLPLPKQRHQHNNINTIIILEHNPALAKAGR